MSLRGSLSLEASLSVPIFVMAVVVLLDIINMYGVRMRIQASLYNAANQISKYYYAYEVMSDSSSVKDIENNPMASRLVSWGFSSTVIRQVVLDDLPEDFFKSGHIVDGSSGISFMFSDVINSDGDIDLVASYKLCSPLDVFGLNPIKVTSRVKVRAFKGDKEDKEEELVYVAPSGVVYHKDINCTYIKVKIYSTFSSKIEDLRSDDGSKYYPCSFCGSGGHGVTFVFYTKYGNRYHASSLCSQINRGVLAIPIDQVGDRRPCSKCCAE